MSLQSPNARSYLIDTSASPSPPLTRGSSPSPSLSPSSATSLHHHLSCPPLDRCFSTSSTLSTISGRSSSSSRASTGSVAAAGAISRRRGYVRTQGVDFADSARARDSVLSLGSIAHLQYYFARTGILDGKGGRMARERKNRDAAIAIVDESSRTERQALQAAIEEEDEEHEQDWEGHEAARMMLPPTVSTYSHNARYIPPPPDVETLRSDLREALLHVTKAMVDAKSGLVEDAGNSEESDKKNEKKGTEVSERHTEESKESGRRRDKEAEEVEDKRTSLLQGASHQSTDEGLIEEKAGGKTHEKTEQAYRLDTDSVINQGLPALSKGSEDQGTHERSEENNSEMVGKRREEKALQFESPHIRPGQQEDDSSLPSPSRGWHQIQGMHVLDVVTLAIRAAKIYYTTHEQPQRLYQIKSERQIREELLGVLDVLKRLALRNFAGGIKADEIRVMDDWVASVNILLARDLELEAQERQDRASWPWLAGAWDGDSAIRRREWLFLHTFLEPGQAELPPWSPPSVTSSLPMPFLRALASGLTLVRLHNRILATSVRRLEAITRFHTDTAKPYRAAENLYFWIKAAEIRWETRLRVNVKSIVADGAAATADGDGSSNGSKSSANNAAWVGFDAALLQWCRAVREEITREWRTGDVRVSSPVLVE